MLATTVPYPALVDGTALIEPLIEPLPSAARSTDREHLTPS
jgi:hypothetical protein